MMLSPRQQATLVSLCRRMVPLPDEPDPAAARLARAVEVRLGTLEPDQARRLGGLLDLLDRPLAGLISAGVPRGFAYLPTARQDAWLLRWERSGVPLLRTAFQALRRVVLSTYYADPANLAAIGHRGPLHLREPAVPWEGPLPGAATDAEPVARLTGSRAARVIPILPQLELLPDPELNGLVAGA